MATPTNPESRILHETVNLYLYDDGKTLEIRLNGNSHAVVVGSAPKKGADVEKLKRTMSRLETDIASVRRAFNHR